MTEKSKYCGVLNDCLSYYYVHMGKHEFLKIYTVWIRVFYYRFSLEKKLM